MLIQVVDANGIARTVVWQAQDPVTDRSGALGAGAVGVAAAFQQVAPANPGRSGWLFQNTSSNPMLLCELAAGQVAGNSWLIDPGEAFPPCGYPVPTGIISVVGQYSGGGVGPSSQAGDTFTCREW